MKVRIDEEICAGFRVCIGVLPELFEMHDDGYAVVTTCDVPPEHEDTVLRAASQCPSNAIIVEESED